MPTVEEYFNEGIKHLKAKEWDEAIACFTDVIKLEPADAAMYAAAYNNRAYAYGQKGDYDHAIEDCNKAIDIDPNYAGAYHNRGGAYSEKGAYDLALADLSKAIELNPGFASAYYNRGNVYRMKGNYGQAIKDYNKAVELDSNHVSAYYNRGNIYGGMGEYNRAIEDYNKAIAIKPNFADAYNARGNAHVGKGDYNLAIEDCSKAIELDSNMAEAYHSRGTAYAGKENHDRAIEDFDKAIELNPDFPDAYNSRGIAYAGKGDYGRAIESYDRAIKLNPRYTLAHYNRGNAHNRIGDYNQAIKCYNEATKLDSNNIYAHNNLGTACYKKGDYEEAIKAFDKAIQLNSKLSDLYCNRGLVHYEKVQYERAIEDFNKTIELNPDFVNAYYYRANAYKEIGKPEEESKDRKEVRRLQWGRDEWFQKKLAKLKKEKQRRALKQLRDAVLNFRDKLRFSFSKSQSATVAHYTSRGILQDYFGKEGGRFRLYSSDSMNDPTEGREIFRITNKKWGINLEKEVYFEEESKNHEVTYIGSFVSGEGCEDKLLFWRTYGEDALGCSLSFGEEALSKTEDSIIDEHSTSVYAPKPQSFVYSSGPQSSVYATELQPSVYAAKSQSNESYEHHAASSVPSSKQQNEGPEATLEPHAFYKVVYGKDEAVSNMLKKYKAQIKHLLEERDNSQKEVIRELLRGLFNEIRFLVKSHYYEDEHEVRIVFVQKHNSPRVKIHTDINNHNRWRSYIELNEKFHPEKIMMGPQVKDIQAIKIWFDNNQHTKIKGEDVHFSPAPYVSYS